ncbi:hypothetical protein [Phenylobacterium sp.]|jgi:hypothetical protein|uniref:hypothetical protein n=1 Tax=Phenylobacterium sp. TaxID=1871053 RepID=UPI002E3021D3|nr:hypothetical protein [Phenylobacterium sp.]HEX3365228.1 hypothetical protein [Phenylobacterium sp.]
MSGDQPEGGRRGLGVADWLGLAAAPTLAIMALLTAGFGGAPPPMICAAAPSPLGGMAAMYLLMSAFHSPAWLKLLSRRGPGRWKPAPGAR